MKDNFTIKFLGFCFLFSLGSMCYVAKEAQSAQFLAQKLMEERKVVWVVCAERGDKVIERIFLTESAARAYAAYYRDSHNYTVEKMVLDK